MIILSLSTSVTSAIAHHGVYAVFALLLIDAVFPAFSELVMLYAGALASGAIAGQHPTLLGHELGFGAPSFLALALAGTVGYLVGALAGWAIGFYGGRPLISRHARWLHLDEQRLVRSERWFARYGSPFVLLGRITPLVRSFVSIPAGVFRVELGRYTVFTLAGSAIWAFAFAGAGWALGTGYERVHSDFRYVEYAVVVAVVAAAAYALRRRRQAGRRRRALSDLA